MLERIIANYQPLSTRDKGLVGGIVLAFTAFGVAFIKYSNEDYNPSLKKFDINQSSPTLLLISSNQPFTYGDHRIQEIIDQVDRRCHLAGGLPALNKPVYTLPVVTQIQGCRNLLDITQ